MEDKDHYHRCLAEAIATHAKVPDAPRMRVMTMMSLIQMSMPSPTLMQNMSKNQVKKAKAKQRQQLEEERQDSLSNMIGGKEYRAMIHQEISIAEAIKFEKGHAALEKEWEK